jgi:hypothetical protein
MESIATQPQMINFSISEEFALKKIKELDDLTIQSNTKLFLKNSIRFSYPELFKYIISKNENIISHFNKIDILNELNSVEILTILIIYKKYVKLDKLNNSLIHRLIIEDKLEMVELLLKTIDTKKLLVIDTNISTNMVNLLKKYHAYY